LSGLLPLAAGADNCVRFANVAAGEQVLLLADPSTPQVVIDALATASASRGAAVSVLVKEPTPLGAPLAAPVAAAMKAADMVFDLGYPTVHSEAGFLASFDHGTRNLIVRPDPGALADEAARWSIERFYELGKRTQALVREQRTVRLTDPNGSDFTMTVPPGAVGAYIGPVPYEPGPAVPGYIGTFPPGTTVWGDLGCTANGRLVVDAAYHYPRLSGPVAFTIEDGWVTAIDGGDEASVIWGLTAGLENANRLAECGFGLNPSVNPALPQATSAAAAASSVLAWTRKAGAFFFGMGGNTLMGGTHRSALVPVYAIITRPTLTIGDQLVIEDGRFDPDGALGAAAA
jgi:2,5-dihydroxypyridine 5,6-dioxygenase